VAGSSSETCLRGARRLDDLKVDGRRSLGTLLYLKLHLLALRQALEARSLDGGVMHKDILAAVLRGDEPEALGVAEPLDDSCNHGNTSVCL